MRATRGKRGPARGDERVAAYRWVLAQLRSRNWRPRGELAQRWKAQGRGANSLQRGLQDLLRDGRIQVDESALAMAFGILAYELVPKEGGLD